jgi:hypothetical protein
MLRGEIIAPNHYHVPKGKTKGTKSTSYYSIKKQLPSLTYFTQIVNKKSYKKQMKKVWFVVQ